MTRPEADDLFREYARSRDHAVMARLVEENLPLVRFLTKRFIGRGAEGEDLFQYGCIGLLKAIDRFDPDYSVRFSTYAVPVILGEIRRSTSRAPFTTTPAGWSASARPFAPSIFGSRM